MKKEKNMKNALIRILAIMTLATSVSAFAASNDPKQSAENNASTCASQDNATKSKKDPKASDIPAKYQNEKDYDHFLLSIYG
jgi:nitrate reductase cytochrome c-type subunit